MILSDFQNIVNTAKAGGGDPRMDAAELALSMYNAYLAMQPEFGGGSGFTVGGSKGPGKIPKVAGDGIAVNWDDDETADPGSAGTLDAVLAAGNTTDEGIIFDETLTIPTTNGAAVTKIWFKFDNLAKTTDGAPYQRVPFQISQKAVRQGGDDPTGKVNETMMFGWNLNPGGGAEIAGRPGIGISFESNYRDAGQRLLEYHDFYIAPTGEQIRMKSYTVRSADFVIDYYKTVSRFYLKLPELAETGNEKQYFVVSPSLTGCSMGIGSDMGGRDGGIKAVTFEANFDAGGGFFVNAAGLAQNELFSQGFLAWNLPGQRISSLAGQTNRKLLGTVQDQVIDDLETDNVAWSGTPSRAWRRGHYYNLHTRTKAGTPTTSDIPDGYWMIYKDTSGGSIRLWVNDGGTMKSVTLT
jgi:hypothetical protein